jgi:MFS family permease
MLEKTIAKSEKHHLPWFPWIGRRPFYGWVLVFVSAVTMFTQGITNQGFSTYLSHLQIEFGWSKAILAGPRAITQVENSILGPIEGFLVDRLGPRIMVMIGSFVMGAGLIMFGMADSLWMYYTANIIIAFGTGFQGLLVLSVVINHWFRRKRTLAQSFMGTGYALAGIIGVPIIVAAQTSLGWRMTAIGSGIIIWIVGFPAAMYLIRKPELYGLLPDGNVASNTPNSIKIDEHDFTLKEALRTRAFWLLGISNALGNFGMSSV